MPNNVYICQFSLAKIQQYDIKASVKDSGFDYPDIKDILSMLEDRTESDEISLNKKRYFPFSLELTDANHFFIQSKIVPNALWAGIEKKEIELPARQDYIFSVWDGGRVFNKSCANILKQHRLGENILTPVQIYDLSTGELASDEVFYFLNLYERRQYICINQSDTKTFKKVFDIYRNDIYTNYDFIQDNQLEVDLNALNCDVDLWHDDRLGGHFFMSDSLYQSLNQAGMVDKFNPHTCKLI